MKFKDSEALREELEEKMARLAVLENNENTDEYDEVLDCEGDVQVAGLTFSPSQIVKEMDPTAYRCGMNDYNDSAITEINDEIEQLEADIKEAEAEEKQEEQARALEAARAKYEKALNDDTGRGGHSPETQRAAAEYSAEIVKAEALGLEIPDSPKAAE